MEVLWLANGRVRIQSFQWVGVVRLPDGRSIRIIPKLAGDELRVLAMLGFVGGLPAAEITQLQRDLETSVDRDGLELLCHLLAAASSRLLSSGPFQDYRNHRDTLPYVRGRLDLRRQAFMHYGRIDMLACEFQEFDHDVLENRLLRTALERARLLSRNPELRRRCAMLHDEFLAMAPGPVPHASEIKRNLHYDRRNEHYRAAHVWALALLEGQGVDKPFRDAGFAISTFLIDMNSLFERFATWLVTRSLSSNAVSVHPQHRDRTVLKSRGRPWGTLKPDMLVSAAGSNLAVAGHDVVDTTRG